LATPLDDTNTNKKCIFYFFIFSKQDAIFTGYKDILYAGTYTGRKSATSEHRTQNLVIRVRGAIATQVRVQQTKRVFASPSKLTTAEDIELSMRSPIIVALSARCSAITAKLKRTAALITYRLYVAEMGPDNSLHTSS